MRPSDKIEKLIRDVNIQTNTKTDEAVLNDVLSTFVKSAGDQQKIWRIIMKSKLTKLAAAAVIIIVGLISLSRFGGSIDGTSIALAQMAEKMKQMPWMHCVSNMKRPGEKNAEYWFSFDMGIEVQKYENGKLRFYDYETLLGYFYAPETNEVTISRIPENRLFASGAFAPWDVLEKSVELLSENEGATITHETDETNNVERYKVRVPRGTPEGLCIEEWIFTANSLSQLVISVNVGGYDPNGTFMEVAEASFEYPDNGPRDIYEIGAPHNATIVDNRPAPEVDEIIRNYHTAREKKLNRYIALIKYSRLYKNPEIEVVEELNILYVDGDLSRYESLSLDMESISAQREGRLDLSIEMGDTIESVLSWGLKSERVYFVRRTIYDGKYVHMLRYNKSKEKIEKKASYLSKGGDYPYIETSYLGDAGFFRFGPGPVEPVITIVENEYSKDHGLICLQKLKEGMYGSTSEGRRYKMLCYLNPQKDYLCQRFDRYFVKDELWKKEQKELEVVNTELIAKPLESLEVREVTEFGQTTTGKWYPREIKCRTNTQLSNGKTKERFRIHTIYVDVNPRFPEGVFNPEILQ